MRGVDHDIIKVGRDIKLDGSLLYFQFTNCYTKIYRQWSRQYADNAPAKSTMKEALVKDSIFEAEKASVQYNSGSTERLRSSAIIVDIFKMPDDLKGLLKSEIQRQEFEQNINPFSPEPPTNTNNNEGKGNENEDPKLPF